MSNNQYLARQMARFGVDRAWVSLNLLVNRSTVDRWLQPKIRQGKKNPSYRHMPDMAVALLDYTLADNRVSKEC